MRIAQGGILSLLFAVALMAGSSSAQLAEKKTLTLTVAKQIAAAAEAEAIKNNFTMVIAVLDDGGNLIFLERMDETQLASIQIAQGKAHTALAFKRPTKALEDAVKQSPGQLDARLLLARIDLKTGDRAAAEDQLQAVLVLNPHGIAAGDAGAALRLRMEFSAAVRFDIGVAARARLSRTPLLNLIFSAGRAGPKYQRSGQRQMREVLQFHGDHPLIRSTTRSRPTR